MKITRKMYFLGLKLRFFWVFCVRYIIFCLNRGRRGERGKCVLHSVGATSGRDRSSDVATRGRSYNAAKVAGTRMKIKK